ncbi:MAG: BlaI/MecI/CopY family transcriptional regulator [Armatimonadetes bacterium]|nr:BlaI/MecI/CopY family transcriptional regulator [Armatimonadota bacterium]
MRRTRDNRIGDVGELQLKVLDLLGELGEATVHGLLERFAEDARPRYTTVLTVLQGLERKGLVRHRTIDRTHVFEPTGQARQVRPKLLRDVVAKVFGGSPAALVAALLDVEEVTPEVVAELQALLAAHPEPGEGDGS